MNTEELRQKSVAELQKEILALLKEQFNLRMQKGTGQLTRTDQLGKVRRAVARAKTILKEKQGEK